MKKNLTYLLTNLMVAFPALAQNASAPLELKVRLYCKNNPNYMAGEVKIENGKPNLEDILTAHLNCKSINDELDLQNSIQKATKLKINLPKPVLDFFNNLLSNLPNPTIVYPREGGDKVNAYCKDSSSAGYVYTYGFKPDQLKNTVFSDIKDYKKFNIRSVDVAQTSIRCLEKQSSLDADRLSKDLKGATPSVLESLKINQATSYRQLESSLKAIDNPSKIGSQN